MKMMPKYLSILCFTLFAFGYGQQSAPWTLEAAVEHAVKNNLQIRAAYLDVIDAETYKSQAIGNFLPSLNLSAGHSWNIGLNRNLTTNLLEDSTSQFSNGGLDMSLVIYNGRRNVYQLMSANLGVLARQYQLEDMKEDVEKFRGELIEAVAEYDDTLLEKYFEDPDSISEDEVHNALRAATQDMSIIPMICGSAFKNKGVQFLLDAVCRYLPSPEDKEAILGTDPDTGDQISRKPSVNDPFSALAFKIATDPFVGRLAFFRAYSGRLDAGSYVLNNRSGNKERISRIYQMHANKQNSLDFIEAGDIGAAVGFKDIKTGDTLSAEKSPIILESMDFPDPVIGIAVEPKTKADVDKLGMALAKLAEEDPTFQVKTDEASGQTIISGMGELHLDIIVDRLRREFKVDVNQGQPQVEYKEAITAATDHREVYKKQSGGRGKFADIVFTLEPAEEGKSGLEFVNKIKGGNVPKEYIPSVEKGFKQAMSNGPLAGFEVDAIKVTLKDGSFHPVDSDSLSFELAAKIGYKQAAKAAGAVIMEPIMKLEVLTPEENMGDIVGDLNRRRGQVISMDDRAGSKVVKATVPLSEMFGYVTSLRTLSSGRATSTMEFSHYEQTPQNISSEVIAAATGQS